MKYKTDNLQVRLYTEWACQNVKRFLFTEGHCYSEKHWIGGICDAGYERLDGRFELGDHKSSREAYVSQFFQIAGYDIEISENGVLDANGNLRADAKLS